MTGDTVTRAEFDRLEGEHDDLRGRVLMHDATLQTLTNVLHEIKVDLHELKDWKDDSKVQEIAALRGVIRKRDRIRARILYGLIFGGGGLEILRVLLEWLKRHP